MGQYYYGTIIESETRKPIMAAYCGKLTETGKADLVSFVYELSRGRKGYRQRVVWAGDYSEEKDADGENLYNRISDIEEKGDVIPTTLQDLEDTLESRVGLTDEEDEAADKRNDARKQAYYEAHICNADDSFRDEIRYLCNHDRREYLDLNAYKYMGWEGMDNPLAVLTSEPSCRIQGGGDYFFMEGFDYYSLWSGCILSAEESAPKDYKEIKVQFGFKTPIWEQDTVYELIHGKKDVPQPNGRTFGKMTFRYDDEHLRLACLPKEDILTMYAEWQKRIDTERVYKAYDVLMAALETDPRLEREHEGLTVEKRKWKGYDGSENVDTVAVVDGVDMELYGPDGKQGYSTYFHGQAKLDGIEYDCDEKARRYFRKQAKVKAKAEPTLAEQLREVMLEQMKA